MKEITLIKTRDESIKFELLSEPREVYYWDKESNEIKKGSMAKVRYYFGREEKKDFTEKNTELVEKAKEVVYSYKESDIIFKNSRIVIDCVVYPLSGGFDTAEECITKISNWYKSLISDFQKVLDKFMEAKVVE